MKKILAVAVAICACNSASAYTVTAYFTGQQQIVTTVSGQSAVECQYQYGGSEFTKLFPFGTICPISVQVQ